VVIKLCISEQHLSAVVAEFCRGTDHVEFEIPGLNLLLDFQTVFRVEVCIQAVGEICNSSLFNFTELPPRDEKQGNGK